MKSARRILLLLVALLIVLALWTANTHTPEFRDRAGQILENSIAEERMVQLGNAEQYILIRGIDRTKPILLFLHGGPGTSAMAFNRVHNAELEKHFVFVNWDQRGTGYSLDAGKDLNTLTLKQVSSDLDQLVDLLRAEFGHEKILLVGHSWGSMLGLDYASKHPEKLLGFVGIGQMADTKTSEKDVYDWALSESKKRNLIDEVETLEDIGPPPYANVTKMMAHRGVVNKLGGAWIKPKPDIDYALEIIKAPEFSWIGIWDLLSGTETSLKALFDEFTALDAELQYPEIGVPTYFIVGRDDRVVSPLSAERYLTTLKAPHKKLIWFENSAHSPQWEEPKRYNAVIEKIGRELIEGNLITENELN